MAFLGKLWRKVKRGVRTKVHQVEKQAIGAAKNYALQYGASLIPGGSVALSWVQRLQHFKNAAKGFFPDMPSGEARLSMQGSPNPWLRGHMRAHRRTTQAWKRRYPPRGGIGTAAIYRRAFAYMSRHRRRIRPGLSLHGAHFRRGRNVSGRSIYGG